MHLHQDDCHKRRHLRWTGSNQLIRWPYLSVLHTVLQQWVVHYCVITTICLPGNFPPVARPVVRTTEAWNNPASCQAGETHRWGGENKKSLDLNLMYYLKEAVHRQDLRPDTCPELQTLRWLWDSLWVWRPQERSGWTSRPQSWTTDIKLWQICNQHFQEVLNLLCAISDCSTLQILRTVNIKWQMDWVFFILYFIVLYCYLLYFYSF